MTRAQIERLPLPAPAVWRATDAKGYQHDVRVTIVALGKVQVKVKAHGSETWVRSHNLRIDPRTAPTFYKLAQTDEIL